jgi:hypothetical protein
MAKHKKRHYGSMKDDAEARIMRDGDLIHEDRNAMANLPQEVIMKPYKKPDYTDFDNLDDTITGIDRQIDSDVSIAKRHKSKSKY